QIAPIIRGAVILFAPSIHDRVGVWWRRFGVAPKLIRTPLFINVASLRLRPMGVGHIAIQFFDANPASVIRGVAAAGRVTHAVPARTHWHRILRTHTRGGKHPESDVLRETLTRIEREIRDAFPAIIEWKT